MVTDNFISLPIGAVFEFNKIEFVKIRTNTPNTVLPLDKQNPNCLNLQNGHYCVIGANAVVKIIKLPDDFVPI